MNKPIAVIQSNIVETFQWLKETHKVVKINIQSRIAEDKDGTQYVLISEKEQAYAWEFSDYIVAPNYSSLIDVVRSRIR